MLTLKTFPDINNDIFDIRREVFIKEQNISEEDEFEGGEENFIHLCAYEELTLAGYLRISINDSTLHIGRVAVKKKYRKQGIGRIMMQYAENYGKEKNCKHTELNAQLQAKEFYASLGYHADGEIFLEVGIEHVKMRKGI